METMLSTYEFTPQNMPDLDTEDPNILHRQSTEKLKIPR